jgi:catechol 2,3-dioxygenase-like lactoylglutathione lyase family enzyme
MIQMLQIPGTDLRQDTHDDASAERRSRHPAARHPPPEVPRVRPGPLTGLLRAGLRGTPLPHLDHRGPEGGVYAYILEFDGLGTLVELRLDPDQAEKQRLFDSVTIAVDGRAGLGRWDEHLTACGASHSPVLVSLQAWLIVVEDPDRHRIRLYTLESHGPELTPDYESPWIAD